MKSWGRIAFVSLVFPSLFPSLDRFVDPLPIPPRIVITKPSEITIKLTEFQAKLYRDLPETTEWGYNGTSPGPTIEVERGQKLTVHWKNELPTTHLFKEPAGADMGGNLPDVRNVTHLHGAVVSEPEPLNKVKNNDGWPDAWNVPGEEQIAEYPNDQSARTLWYHDHAIGETGRNVAAGLAGLYLIHDDYERSLNLPSGDYDIPLMIQNKGINDDGSLYYSKKISVEYYGNSFAVNGKIFPYLEVEPRKYRFRIVNANNARTVSLKLTDFESKARGPAFYQIGTDSGFLANTVILNDPADPKAPELRLASAERADVVIDFSKFAGRNFVMENTEPPDDLDTIPLFVVMLFKVKNAVSNPDTSSLPMQLRPIAKLEPQAAVKTRDIVFDGMDMPDNQPMLLLNGKTWKEPVEERPVLGTTEIWRLVNTLPQTHPFHIHLVEFQVLDRTPFDVDEYQKSGKVVFTGPADLPDPNEQGWKDTVRVPPQAVTRIIMRFAPFTGYYVYHCHILEHEDMDMMRPFEVVAPSR